MPQGEGKGSKLCERRTVVRIAKKKNAKEEKLKI